MGHVIAFEMSGERAVAVFLLVLCALCCVNCASMTLQARYDTIVVGIGSAGAAAASTLAGAGKHVLALEAEDRIGGRVHTVELEHGVVEMGAEWIHGSKNSPVYDAAIRNNVTILSQKYKQMTFFSNSSLVNEDMMEDLVTAGMTIYTKIDTDRVEPVGTYTTRELLKYINQTRPELLKDENFLEDFLELMNLVVNSNEASDDWNDVTTASVFEELDGDQGLSWHAYGYKTFFDILLNKYKDGPGYPSLDIKLNKEVTHISWSEDGVVVACRDGTEYTADNVIVTVSVGVLKERYSGLFTPPLPDDKIAAIKRTTLGVMDKIQLIFDRPFWPTEYSYFGFFWRKEDKRKIPIGDLWTTKISGATTTMASNNILTLWITGESAKIMENLAEDELQEKSMHLLRRFMGNMNVPEPTKVMRSTWYSNPFARGSFTYDDISIAEHPKTRSTLAKPLIDSAGIPRVLFAGEATSAIHFATVHGACETGFREAKRLLK